MTDNHSNGPHGLDIRISEQELIFLREAGVAPELLGDADRAALIRALIRQGNVEALLALVYKFGILRAMLLHKEERKEAKDKDDKKCRQKKRNNA